MSTTLTILDTTTYGTPSGNYDGSSMDWASDGQRAADYYRGYGGLQTLRYNLIGFQGRMIFEATLDPTATDANWFSTLDLDYTASPVSELRGESVQGNFTWMRVRFEDFSQGTIQFVTISY